MLLNSGRLTSLKPCSNAQAGPSLSDPTNPPMQITITVTDADGVAVTEWEAGTEYTLAISSYAPVTNAWIHSTGGTLAPGDGYALAECGAAVYSQDGAAAHEVTWTAPMDTSACVTVSTAQASGPAEGYNTNTVRLIPRAVHPVRQAGVGTHLQHMWEGWQARCGCRSDIAAVVFAVVFAVMVWPR